jgi:hypothetical protein
MRAAGVEVKDALRQGFAEPLVYLLDSAGAGFGYRYSWDPFGPRSAELAEDIADLTEADLTEPSELDESEERAAKRVRAAVDAHPGAIESVAVWVQLLAAVDYLQSTAGLQLSNGDRPPYIERNFEERVVEAAKETARSLHES